MTPVLGSVITNHVVSCFSSFPPLLIHFQHVVNVDIADLASMPSSLLNKNRYLRFVQNKVNVMVLLTTIEHFFLPVSLPFVD